jgi:hypothetical protein
MDDLYDAAVYGLRLRVEDPYNPVDLGPALEQVLEHYPLGMNQRVQLEREARAKYGEAS